jgi:hypothetical protein
MVQKANNLQLKTQSDLEKDGLKIYESYMTSKYSSIKHTSYFHVYENLLTPFRGKDITFVEVGVYNGGSLFMWRDFFGPKARIIGVEFNPDAKHWESEGFEIHIGDQSDANFWRDFYTKVGPVDVVLDDGGHSNAQQIVTVAESVAHINDGGMIVVEDTHASYLAQFGNPSKYSFMNYAFDVVHSINNRFPLVKSSNNLLSAHVSSVQFYDSIVSFHIDRRECFVSTPTTNEGISRDAVDFRHHGTLGRAVGSMRRKLFIKFSSFAPESFLSRSATFLFSGILFLQHRVTRQTQKKYFG